ncbi:uncharacterized protein KY384_002318 [Bacidia gigantensis]|uniref:uncharacterized protein n=1 Tax=Bacidia gigantensis TaxID=2732470 RepID=UPI001D045C4E|nr:uncharacterized protein KY384_002318 [Bacidia gigantensis]KAG8532441.1 hypothetical protein KY384_002318 [Bacidia gigantensis]
MTRWASAPRAFAQEIGVVEEGVGHGFADGGVHGGDAEAFLGNEIEEKTGGFEFGNVEGVSALVCRVDNGLEDMAHFCPDVVEEMIVRMGKYVQKHPERGWGGVRDRGDGERGLGFGGVGKGYAVALVGEQIILLELQDTRGVAVAVTMFKKGAYMNDASQTSCTRNGLPSYRHSPP